MQNAHQGSQENNADLNQRWLGAPWMQVRTSGSSRKTVSIDDIEDIIMTKSNVTLLIPALLLGLLLASTTARAEGEPNEMEPNCEPRMAPGMAPGMEPGMGFRGEPPHMGPRGGCRGHHPRGDRDHAFKGELKGELLAEFKRLESRSHQGRIALLQEADTCIQQAQKSDDVRSCEQKERAGHKALHEELKPQRDALRTKIRAEAQSAAAQSAATAKTTAQ